ncbi:MAG: hypothetical protein H6Q37_1690 [Chloroflexi bacterium]|jgi:hypothetical protein|nr:hypothetical protein [Chloroflexota bacterium]
METRKQVQQIARDLVETERSRTAEVEKNGEARLKSFPIKKVLSF